MMYYNFVRIHSKLRVTPAMAAGVSDRLWEVADIVALVEAEEAKADFARATVPTISVQFNTWGRRKRIAEPERAR